VRTTVVPKSFSAWLKSSFSGMRRRVWRKWAVAYVTGLIQLVRFRSVSEIGRRMAGGAVDALHHFIHDSPWEIKSMESAQQCGILRRAGGNGNKVYLAIDDTPVERCGPHIEGLGVHHSARGLVRGLCAVTAVVNVAGRIWCWAVRGYRPKRTCEKGEFRSKVDLAVEILESAVALGSGVTVLMDSWYACRRILNRVAIQGWRYVAAVKTNRRLYVDDRLTTVRNLAKGKRKYFTVRLSKKRKVHVAGRIAELPGVGPVAVFITKTKGKTKFLISNDLSLSPEAAVRLYAERFRIETFHRDVKQHLGFGELWVRSWQAVQKHWTLCSLAYNTLQNWNAFQRSRQRTFGAVIRAFRDKFPLNSPMEWYYDFRAAA